MGTFAGVSVWLVRADHHSRFRSGRVATVFAEYFLRLLGKESPSAVHYVAAGAILLVAVFNIVGIQLGALVQNLTTGAKYGALVILVLAAFLVGANNPAPAPTRIEEVPNETSAGDVRAGIHFLVVGLRRLGGCDFSKRGSETPRAATCRSRSSAERSR